MTDEDRIRTEVAKSVELLPPLEFLRSMAEFARLNASVSEGYVREGYEIWARQYEACVLVIEGCGQSHHPIGCCTLGNDIPIPVPDSCA